MYNFMKKIPGGLLLVPMLVSALINTFTPNLFHNLGGMSEALFTTNGINYVVAATCFCSGTSLDPKRLAKVFKKQGTLLIVKTIVCVAVAYFYIRKFGLDGIWGISAIALVATLCSTNPSLYLALEQDFGTEDDQGAFGLIGLFCVPAYPMLVFSVAQTSAIDWTPIISTLVPIIFGMIVGNLDKNMAEFFKPGMAVLTPFMGWAFGAGINLVDAFKAGLQGIILVVVYYLAMLVMLFVERTFIHEDGISSIAMSSVAGMSVSVPSLMAASNADLAPYVTSATAQIALAVVLTSLITPVLAKRMDITAHPEHRQSN